MQIASKNRLPQYFIALVASGKHSQEEIKDAVTTFKYLLHQTVSLNDVLQLKALQNIVKCDVNEANQDGETPLHIACRQCSIEVVQVLVADKRCNLNAKNSTGESALHIAVHSELNSVQKVRSILPCYRCNPNITNSEGYTPLHYAIRRKEFEIAAALVRHVKVNLNAQDNDGNTPLHEAVMGETPVDVVKSLTLHKNCNPNKPNHEGKTPLQLSVDLGKIHYAEVLITSGKCSNEDIVKATEGTLLLHQAVSLNRPELALRLIEMQEYDVNETNSDDETALHIACRTSHGTYILQKLVEDSRCDLNTQNQNGNSALHLALLSEFRRIEKVQYIAQSERCNPNITDNNGHTPLHVAVRRKEFQGTAILLQHSKCNPNIQGLNGNTPLHVAIINNASLSNVKPFLNHRNIDLNIQNVQGNTPLHEAVMGETPVDVLKALILCKTCNPNIINNAKMTPLKISVNSEKIHYIEVLVMSGKCSHEDIVKTTEGTLILHQAVSSHNIEFLTALRNAGVNMNMSNSDGETALHIACREGNIEVTQLLLQSKANILAVDNKGSASIHLACAHSNFECLRLLLGHPMCNPNQQNAIGDTPLHILCRCGRFCDMKMLHALLSSPGINPECANHAGQIPAELAKSNYSAIEVISKCLEHKDEQLETYLKIFVVGNSGGGKSTLIKAITTQRSRSIKNSFKAKHVNPSEVPPHTAGIVPLSFNSKHFGHAVLYDFAGQHEYYSSHAAVMENLVLPSPPLFLLLIDISKPMDEIKTQFVYWWMFINNHSKQTTAPPHVVLVGSHKDKVKERGENVQKTMEQITNVVRDIPVSFQFDCSKAFPLDCRKLVSRGLTALLTQLKLTCQTLRQTADIDLHCHILKAFLTTNFHNSTACEFPEIVERMKSEDDLLPQEPSQLIPLLSTLSDKGYILLLQNHTDVNKSWVILKPELLLAEVNGSIFAPHDFKEHCSEFAMSTGVVALSNIKKEFVNYSSQVIIGYLTHLEFCFRIKDQHTLEMITKDATLQLPTYGSENADEYYFFPALIQKESPSDVRQPQETIKYECGWLYRCNEPTEQLTTRFLHVLILRLAFSCDPPDEPTERESVVLLRSCSVWKHGIAWWTNDGIETIVEVGLQCRWVAVMLRCPDTHKVQCAELRTKVITTVLKTKQDFCPAIGMKEFLIAPSSLQYPFEGRELTLYSMKEIAKVIITGKEFPKDTEGKSTIHTSQLLPFEPFFNFGEDLICNLFTPDQSRESEISRHNMFQIANKCYKMLDDFKKAL